MLRGLRQSHPALRMIITGSIGLHHVVRSLKDKNYTNSPVNDMVRIAVTPLEHADAKHLGIQLIEGEELVSKDKVAAAAAIAREADNFPFYIHCIVKELKVKGRCANPEDILEVVAALLIDPNDPWELLHYRDRIPSYYGADAEAVRAILDELAGAREKASINELLGMLKTCLEFDDRERLILLLSLMERDHYLQRLTDGSFRFQFPLIRRWWKITRGL